MVWAVNLGTLTFHPWPVRRYVPIEPKWTFVEVRRALIALGRELEDFDITTVPARFAQVGDPHADILEQPSAADASATRFRLDGAWIARPSG